MAKRPRKPPPTVRPEAALLSSAVPDALAFESVVEESSFVVPVPEAEESDPVPVGDGSAEL